MLPILRSPIGPVPCTHSRRAYARWMEETTHESNPAGVNVQSDITRLQYAIREAGARITEPLKAYHLLSSNETRLCQLSEHSLA